MPSVNASNLLGVVPPRYRRRNINGDCTIAQAGTSFVAAVDRTWTLDGYRWLQTSDAVVTVAQAADAPADNEFQYSLRVTVTTADAAIAAGQYGAVSVPIEGYDVRDLIGKPFVVGFRVRSPKAGVHCVAIRNAGADRSFVAEFTMQAANTWETKYVTVPAGLITAGTWNWSTGTGLEAVFALAAGATFQTAAGAWAAGNFLATANQVNCLDTVGNIFAITGLQVAPGSVDTPFEHTPVAIELLRAQRYCSTQATVIWGAYAGAGVQVFFPYRAPVPMRAAPTVTFPGAAYANASGLTTSYVSDQLVGMLLTITVLGYGYVQTGITLNARLP
jgi:hypothetical protein